MSDFLNKVLKTNKNLTKDEKSDLKAIISNLKKKEFKIRKDILNCEMALLYDSYKEKGFNLKQINKFYMQDKDTINSAEEFLKKQNNLKKYLFGYPANMEDIDCIEELLKCLEIKMPLSNNCGENYNRKIDCNYAMDSKEWEYKIVEEICKNLGLGTLNYEGYITSGGTEGNFFGIKNGFLNLPNSVFYYSCCAHYSIQKFIDLIGKESIKVQCDSNGKIDTLELLTTIKKNWQERKKSAIILLTWGTTEIGAIDNVEYIIKYLKENDIPYYVHLDAAFYGGIPKNQKQSPCVKIKKLDIDSISVSLHKYIGTALVNGVVLWKKKNLKNNYITYIGQNDNTILGSRSLLPFSTYYRVNKILNRSEPNKYLENVNYFQNQLDKNLLKYSKTENSNIFVFENLHKYIIKKYQLAEINNKRYHIIIMPFLSKKYINELVRDIKKFQKN